MNWQLSRPSEDRLTGTWLGLKFQPAQILRGRVSAEQVLSNSRLGLTMFVLHWEEVYYRMDFLFVLAPFHIFPASWLTWAWLPSVLAMPINTWWLDRLIGREAGLDHLARRPVIWARRLLSAVPILGLIAIPCWRWLSVAQPRWLFRFEKQPILILSPTNDATAYEPQLQRATDRPSSGANVHFPPASIFLLWFFVANFFFLKAAIASLVLLRIPEVDYSVLVTMIVLRFSGFVLEVAYIRDWHSRRGLNRTAALAQGLLALAWLAPLPFVYLINLFMASKDKHEESLAGLAKKTLPSLRESGYLRGKLRLPWRWLHEQGPAVSESRFANRVRGFRSLKTAMLLFEVPLAMSLFNYFRFDSPIVAFPFAMLFLWLVASAGFGLLPGLAGIWSHRRSTVPKIPEWSLPGWFSLFSTIAFLGGLFIGASFLHGSGTAGPLIEQIGKFGSLLALIPAFRWIFKQQSTWTQMAWPFFYAYLWVLGIEIRKGEPDMAPPSMVILAFVFAIFHIRAVRFTPWALWPFRWEDLRDPRLPLKTRLHLIALAVIGIAPFTSSLAPLAYVGRRRLEMTFSEFWSCAPQEPGKNVAN